jgi:D-alanine-D-alanine ligase
MLELMGIPYVGHNPLNAAILDGKHVFKYMLDGLAVPTPRYLVWNHPGDTGDPRTTRRFQAVFGGYAGRFVVKPVSGRASLHVKVVDQAADLDAAVAAVTQATGNHVLIEQYLPGREFTLAVAGPVIARERALYSHDRPTHSCRDR